MFDQAQAITDTITEIVEQIAPDATYVPKYGGELIEAVTGDPKSQVGGIFSYASHVSLEFSHGSTFDDPNRHLEGKGKHRRHLKFHSPDDIGAKECRYYLKQALAAYIA